DGRDDDVLFFPGVVPDTPHRGFGCEELETHDDTFDVFITQDVMEHCPVGCLPRSLQNAAARVYIHTTPIYKTVTQSICCAERLAERSQPAGSELLHGWWQHHS